MALQGTLDTFALADVLRLLASTKKTGRLRLTGDRGIGSVWVDGGGVVDAEASGGGGVSTPVDVLFELMRYHEGSFTFEPGSPAPHGGSAQDVEPLLASAEEQLDEWKEIEAVVPSLDAWVTLAPELPGGEITLDAKRWRTVATVGSGATVESVADALELGEVAASRVVKELVEMGLATVGTHRFSRAPEPFPGADDEPEILAEPEPPSFSYTPSFTVDHEEVGQDVFPSPAPEVAAAVIPPPPPPAPPVPRIDDYAPVEDEADEIARQLATLSPRAARAVAAAAKAQTEEEREAALAEAMDDDDTPINRGLLLKFLGSVQS